MAAILAKVVALLLPLHWAHLALRRQGIPKASSGNPLAASAPWKRRDLHRLGQADCEALGGIFYFRILGFNCVQISDPWLAAEVLELGSRRPDLVDKPRGLPLPIYDCFDRGTSDPPQPSMISAAASDPLWRVIRKGVAPAFSAPNIRRAFAAVEEVTGRLLARLREHGAQRLLDLDGALMCHALDVIGKVAFSRDFKATMDLNGPGAAACRMIKEICAVGVDDMRNPLRPILRAMPFLPEAWTYRRRTLALTRSVQALMRDLAEEVHARGARSEEEDPTVAGHLMRVRDAAGRPLPFTRLWSEISIVFMAGMETTGHTISWTLYLVSQHPAVEARLAAELDAAGLLLTRARPRPRALAHADLGRLTYLQSVVKEAQRLFSVAPLVVRRALRDVRVGQYDVPAGTCLLLHVYAMHTTSANWSQPAEFLPERWLESDAEYARWPPEGGPAETGPASHCSPDPEASWQGGQTRARRFMPFLEGSRQCVGMSLARMTTATTVAALLSCFTFRLSDDMGGPEGVRASEAYYVTIQPAEGLRMHAIPRPC
ncbi:hypothetical protein WJX81_004899 [Elliptochloris bilobata]|uniref:Cytochrome P450 n=1 Tax=Elliptochloris bilobata TaxID=381761 RepID=A0AAW1RU45_9CHLO